MTDKADKGTPGGVFTGDTLFIAGCGRFFEGDGAQMLKALNYLTTLPEETVVYNGHEYTTGSVRIRSISGISHSLTEWQAAFGKSVDPTNEAINRLQKLAKDNKITTGLTTIGDEKEWNVFLRLGTDPEKYAKPYLIISLLTGTV